MGAYHKQIFRVIRSQWRRNDAHQCDAAFDSHCMFIKHAENGYQSCSRLNEVVRILYKSSLLIAPLMSRRGDDELTARSKMRESDFFSRDTCIYTPTKWN